jgi:hypothetical protein
MLKIGSSNLLPDPEILDLPEVQAEATISPRESPKPANNNHLKPANRGVDRDIGADSRITSVSVSNVLSEEKRQEVIAPGTAGMLGISATAKRTSTSKSRKP